MRDYKLYFEDIKEAIESIEKYTSGMDYNKFCENKMVIDAVIRNLEVIGEATKNIPEEIKKQHPDIEWKKISGLRDILAHEYFGVDIDIVWDILKNKITELKKYILFLIEE